MEQYLKNYNRNKILRIKFDDLMNNFEATMRSVSVFLGIQPRIRIWQDARKLKVGRETSDVKRFLRNKNKK